MDPIVSRFFYPLRFLAYFFLTYVVSLIGLWEGSLEAGLLGTPLTTIELWVS